MDFNLEFNIQIYTIFGITITIQVKLNLLTKHYLLLLFKGYCYCLKVKEMQSRIEELVKLCQELVKFCQKLVKFCQIFVKIMQERT